MYSYDRRGATDDPVSKVEAKLKSLFPNQLTVVERGGRGFAVEVVQASKSPSIEERLHNPGVRLVVSGPKWPAEADVKLDSSWKERLPKGLRFRRLDGPTDKVIPKLLAWLEKAAPKLKL